MFGTDRRLVVLLAAVAVIGTPAVVLRAFCVGESCTQEQPSVPAPFCSLPATMRDLITAGFYEGRSPDALGVAASTPVVTGEGSMPVRWPSLADEAASMRVPLVFLGAPFAVGSIASDVTLDQIAPTLEPVLGLRRPHGDIRSGRAIEGAVVADVRPSPLVVEIVWRGIGSADLEAAPRKTPYLTSSLARGFAGDAAPGSLPLDPAAVLTTIGSGGLPREHGITGTIVRGPEGGPVPAWSPAAPTSVIAELGDDLDRATDGAAKIALVGTEGSDRGLIGGTWYPGRDDDVVMSIARGGARAAVTHVDHLLDVGWGLGGAPDLVAVVVQDSIGNMDIATRDIVRHVRAAAPETAFVITATGSQRLPDAAVTSGELTSKVTAAVGADVVAASAAGGLFIDRDAAVEAGVPTQRVVDAMRALPDANGIGPLFADAFPAFAVTFGTYC